MDLKRVCYYGIEFLLLSGLWAEDGVYFADVGEISAFVL